MTVPGIEFVHVCKDYRRHFWERKKPAVVDCSFAVEKATVTGFVGPNGAGKTTSIKMLLGLIRPSSGHVLVNGRDPLLPHSRKGLSFLSERPYFYDHLTVRETLRFAYGLQRGYAQSGETEIIRALDAVELSASLPTKVKDLSKGMQQRLSMAQALLCSPELFILDEPMSGLDPLGRRLFREILRTLGKEGKTVFFSTHILDDVESLCSHVVVLSKGRLAYQGPLLHLVGQEHGATECVVRGLADADRQRLGAMGCAVTTNADGSDTIVVPADGDPQGCQRFLCEKGLFCESVSRRSASLEDIIYKGK
jgi:ABC-2 type transport system ATP-binding protein